jgi:hypothetical protein
LPQRKFGQFHFKLWFPEPGGGRVENYSNRNLNETEFRSAVEKAVGLIQTMIKPKRSDNGAADEASGHEVTKS